MNERTKKVYNGFTTLSKTEQSELIKEINKYIKKPVTQKKAIPEHREKTIGVVLGPLGGACPCCGR